LEIQTDLAEKKKDLDDLRFSLGYNHADIVCLYTGRFTNEKDPLTLAKAIDYLHQLGYNNFKALFVGDGDENYIKEILKNKGCKTHPFVEVNKLPFYYQAFDIGVWPKQESTSQLDSAASSMPIIISDNVMDSFRIDGNGLSFKEGNYKNLSDKILSLKYLDKRKKLGSNGSNKILNHYSWDVVAKGIIEDFNKINK
jgi:glycosyltransferase involved in cell wall biosynthesis